MTNCLAQYRQLERRLWLARWSNDGHESSDEETVLDQMEEAWLHLGEEERSILRFGAREKLPGHAREK